MKVVISWWFMLIFILSAMQPVVVFAEEKSSGHVYLDDNMPVFLPCGSDNAFLLIGPDKLLQSLQQQWHQLNAQRSTSPRPLYVEMTGHFEENPDAEGRSADFDGRYRGESLLRSQAESPATCPVLVVEG
ncbi:hypothetical protein [Aeromonas veronii]|uniref:hypothetical protein n=1 Tax=Aeromonas veronii TaxID=654 RepID=UPI0032EBA91C